MALRSKWFVDLFVVVAMFAIVVTAVSPIFASAQTRSALSTCLDNNRQLGRAFALYEDDANGALPPWVSSNQPPAPFSSMTWDVQLMGYLKTRSVFTCPGELSVLPHGTQFTTEIPLRSYSMPQNVSGLRPRQLKAPAKTVVLFEKGTSRCGITNDSAGQWFGQTNSGYVDVTKNYPSKPEAWCMFHGTGFGQGKVFLFADGHAAFFPVILNQVSNTNPFGYYYPNTGAGGNWPRGANGIGYCGSADSAHLGDPTIPGANIPDSM